jgi:nicotinamide-nucleotide amidase
MQTFESKHSDTVAYLKANAFVVVTAKSCTAGLIASRLVPTPGGGQVLDSAYVVYDPKALQRCLGVRTQKLESNNLISEPVAMKIVRSALRNSDANLAISNTGVADNSDPDIAAGTQCYTWLFREQGGNTREFAEPKMFDGVGNDMREASADYALSRIARYHRARK